ncbi:unnamed protein product [Rotaria socialis]|uniref:BEN domain-containing protein n=1 Tax=Rotaria socialis TaxID=392032 RepID=A0A821CVE7_9BILA|nr:unnamed protein product [Rotaria socialis]CAF4611925.1 unnamed protein product [Rotaria socialis]
MQRSKSIESVTSVASSCRGGEKKILSTHMIIQREIDDKMMLLPVTNLVNISVTRIKINNTATFKVDNNSRKQYRGKIIQLGTKEVCMEQLQVFEMTAGVDQHNETDDEIHAANENDGYDERKKSSKKQVPISFKVHDRINAGSNPGLEVSSAKQTTHIVQKTHHLKSKPSQIDEGLNEPSSNEDELYRIITNDSSYNNISSTKSIRKSTTNKLKKSVKDSSTNGFQIEHQREPQRASNSQILINSQIQNTHSREKDTAVLVNSNSEQEQQLHNITSSDMLCQFDVLSKKCNKLTKENGELQLECDRLTKENQIIKKSTMPIPDAAGRQWFINMGKYFSNKTADTNIATHATNLGIDDPRNLVACIQDTTSNTVRQVVRYLYSSDKLLTMKGTEVPKDRRLMIRQFAESQKGPISNRAFNEAINGVFRSRKCELKVKKKQEKKSIATEQSNNTDKQVNCLDKGQKTLLQTMNKNQHSKSSDSGYDKENHNVEEIQDDDE